MTFLSDLFGGKNGYIYRLYLALGGSATVQFVQRDRTGEIISQSEIRIPFLPEKMNVNHSKREGGTILTDGEWEGVIPAASLEKAPLPNNDQMLYNGQTFQIVEVEELRTGNVCLAWRLRLKK